GSEKLFGYTQEEAIGRNISFLIPPELEKEEQEIMKKLMAGKHIDHYETVRVRKGNSRVEVSLTISVLKDKTGKITGVSKIARDITDRKKAEEKIKESERMFSTLFHKSPVMKAIAELPSGKYLEVNDTFADFLGYKKDELIGKTSRELNIVVNTEEREEILKDIQKNGFLRDVETHIISRAGKHRWVSTNIDKVNLKGKDCLLTAAIDITARKEAEAQIQRQRQDIQDFIDSMSTLCAKLATDGKIIIVNKTALLASGLTMQELMNTNFLEGKWWTFDAEVHSRVCKAFKEACSGIAVTYDENIFVFGRVLTINFSLIPIFSSGEKVDYIIAEGRDITALKVTEAALRERTDQLESVYRELEAFTYSVSHDLRAPLRGIIGFTAILEEDYASKLDDEAKRITAVIKNNTMKMGHLIDDLLAFSRMGKQEIVKTQVNSQAMVKEIADELIKQNKSSNRIHWDIRPLTPVKADPNTLRQVWINLITNAIKYSGKRERPNIEIGSYSENGQTIFYVKDNGVGFDEQYKHKLFKVFQRLHSVEEFEGTGVGLALVEKIVSRHGGKVWAQGKENEGACFYFSLPV
ncbi:MAG TPA: PAS domain S-box protein, partial [Chitinophagaceae bacterium]|nr:PAS domain S-box protein [Chitinophagaceae bacterium]